MSDERHLDSVGDSPESARIDRDLAQLLSIAPSPEFAARVRERIRDERTARKPRSIWRAGLAAAAAVALVATFASRAWRTEEAPRDVRTATDIVLPVVATQPEVQPTRRPSALQGPRQARPRRVRAVAAATASDGPSRPDVLVSRDQLRAIARLRELTLKGELTEKDLPPAGIDPGAVTDIRVAPLAIAPLTLPGVEIISGLDGSRPRSQR